MFIFENMDLGQEIKNIRKEAGISQKQMAKSVGLSEIHYCGIENGKRGVTLKVLEKVAKKLKKRVVIKFVDK